MAYHKAAGIPIAFRVAARAKVQTTVGHPPDPSPARLAVLYWCHVNIKVHAGEIRQRHLQRQLVMLAGPTVPPTPPSSIHTDVRNEPPQMRLQTTQLSPFEGARGRDEDLPPFELGVGILAVEQMIRHL